jgi:hypothetical protein
MAATRGYPTQAQRRRAAHLGGHASPAWLHLRGPLATPRRPAPAPSVPYLPGQSGYNKRLRRTAELLRHAIRAVACDTTLWTDDVWIVDSTPVECGRSRETAKCSELAGWAQYGYCASHSRYFWGPAAAPGVHAARPSGRVRAGRGQGGGAPQVLLDIFAVEPELVAVRPGQVLLADKNYYGQEFERVLGELGLRLLRPAPLRSAGCYRLPTHRRFSDQ